MRIFNIIAIFLYTLLFSIIGGALIALSLRAASLETIIASLGHLAHTENIKMGLALTGISLILVNISIAQLSIGRLRKIRTIAFENPYGPVTLSLSAIEDYIRKLTAKMPEIKEIKSSISAGKKGVEVIAKITLYSEVNIPEVTEKLQNAIRLRLQEVLGIEEKVTIRVHVAKIVQNKKSSERKETVNKTESTGFKGEIEYGN